MVNKPSPIFEQVLDNSTRLIDITFNLNTGSKMQGKFETEFINGWLEGIYLESESQLDVRIFIEDKDYTIYHKRDFFGKEFFLIRDKIMDKSARLFQLFDKIAINDTIKVIVKGARNQNLKVTLRVS